MSILIFGEILVDIIDNSWYPGGAPFNVACHLKGMNLKPVIISKIGNDDMGKYLLDIALKKNLNTDYIKTDIYKTGAVEVNIREGEPFFSIIENRAYDYIDPPNVKTAKSSSLLYYGSLAVRSEKSYNSLLKIKEEFNGITFMDINIRKPWFNLEKIEPLLTDIHWLKINSEELNIIAGSSSTIEENINYLSNKYSIGNIICTLGAKGAKLYSSEDQILYSIQGKKIENFINSVGAGDAFSASVISSIINGESGKVLLQKANNFASKVCSLKSAIPESINFYDGL